MTDLKKIISPDEEQNVLYNNIYKLITPYIAKSINPDNEDAVLMTSGTLLAIAVQLYIALYKNNEKVEEILEFAKESVPELRNSMEKYLPTLH